MSSSASIFLPLCYDEVIIRATPPLPIDDDAFLARLDTAGLSHGDATTRALVVVNTGETPRSGCVRFRAAFPIRAAVGAQPVTVRDAGGAVVPSRLTESTVEARADLGLPADRRWWTLTLEFAADDVPAQGWRTFASTFAASPESHAEDDDYWRGLPAADLPVWETDCHRGDIPVTGFFADLYRLIFSHP